MSLINSLFYSSPMFTLCNFNTSSNYFPISTTLDNSSDSLSVSGLVYLIGTGFYRSPFYIPVPHVFVQDVLITLFRCLYILVKVVFVIQEFLLKNRINNMQNCIDMFKV